MTEKLKPCPFCGGQARIGRSPCHDEQGTFAYAVCRSCGAKSRDNYYGYGNDCPVLYATIRDEWNTRTGETK